MKKVIVNVVFLIIVVFGVNVQNGQGQVVVMQGDSMYIEKSDRTLEYIGSFKSENGITTLKSVDYSLSWEFEDEVLTVKGKGEIPDFRNYSYRTSGLPAKLNPANQLPSSITSLIIEDGITRIGDAAFFMCTNLTSVTIPESVTYLNRVFQACKKLTVVEVKNPIPPLGNPFTNVSLKKVKLIIPAGTKTIYAKNKVWKKFGIIEENVVKE